jgi:PhoPQ-activated pathogenicity-related protein
VWYTAACLGIACAGLLTGSARAWAGLPEYVRQPDPAYTWQLKSKISTPRGLIYDLHLVSQVWHGIKWEHQLQVYQPSGTMPKATMLIYNTGGQANPSTIAIGMDLARKTGTPCAILYHIPNQPLLGNKKEDTLIAETFVRYLETRDDTWPLLFPMVKSVVRALDTLQAFSQQTWPQKVEHFVLAGASKRGWTTWLTAAVEPRLKAIAPMVIDTLNMTKQMDHQLEAFGKYSEQIDDYTHRGLVPLPDTPEAKQLWRMVDPYFYRDQLSLPKLLIMGNNDPYWTADALNLYWDGLKGERWICYVPNAGHNLRQRHANGKEDTTQAISALGAFARHQILGVPLPKLDWKHDDQDGKLRLTVTAVSTPRAARLWVAHALTQDFRKAVWQEQAMQKRDKDTMHGLVERPQFGFVAFFGQLEYGLDGLDYQLATQVRVAGRAREK